MAAGAAPDMAPLLVDLPLEVLYDLGIAPARAPGSLGRHQVTTWELDQMAHACWRAVTRP